MTWKHSEASRRSAWTKADVRRARCTPLKPVLEALGYRLTPLQNGNYHLCRIATNIVIKDHYWVCKDEAIADTVRKTSGNAIDFLVEVQGMSFSQAVDTLLSPAKPLRGTPAPS